jgi:dTDP-4-dehydrorhamnose 3,5-epimerase
VKIKKTVLDGPLLAQSSVHGDSRGAFLEWFKKSELEFSLGETVSFSQGNVSKSAKGVLRGIHYSTSEEGQAKWVTCLSGKIIDYVIDLRISSPTFTKYIEIPLSGFDGQGVYIPQGFGHAFVSLEDDSIVSYLVTSDYNPNEEHAINPMDKTLSILWPTHELILSTKDQDAETLQMKIQKGQLPLFSPRG